MQVRLNDLQRNLAAGLKPIYLITGDETLLVAEASAAVIEAAEREGFSERNVIDGGAGMDWNGVFANASNLSLFAERRILDLRLPAKGLDRTASDALRRYLTSPFDDALLLIRTTRLDPRQRSSAWFKAIDAAGVIMLIWPLRLHELPRWLQGRCRAAGLELTVEAMAMLVDRVEGNLLAAVQEIEKLKLAGVESPVDAEALADAVGDASRFDTFELVDAAFGGNPGRVRKMVRVLREEGVPVFMIMGAVNSQLRAAHQMATGGHPRVSQQRARVLEGLVGRFGPSGLESALAECALLDLQAKGMLRGDAWQSLERLLVSLAGTRTSGLAAEVEYLRYH